MKLTILGSGTSGGVPQIACQCSTCMSSDPRDHRLRTSALVQHEGTNLLIDCGPDFREQMIALPEFPHIDGIFITHEHFDHVGGIDDIRPGVLFGDITIYAEDLVAEHLMQRIPYCFTPPERRYPGVPAITLAHIEPHTPVTIGSLTVTPIRVMHGKLPIVGFHVEAKNEGQDAKNGGQDVKNGGQVTKDTDGGMHTLTYITDMKSMPESEWEYIKGTDTLVVNALHYRFHPTHQTVDDAIAFSRRLNPRQTFFVHMSHFILPHAEAEAQLPAGFHFAYDGMEVEV